MNIAIVYDVKREHLRLYPKQARQRKAKVVGRTLVKINLACDTPKSRNIYATKHRDKVQRMHAWKTPSLGRDLRTCISRSRSRQLHRHGRGCTWTTQARHPQAGKSSLHIEDASTLHSTVTRCQKKICWTHDGWLTSGVLCCSGADHFGSPFGIAQPKCFFSRSAARDSVSMSVSCEGRRKSCPLVTVPLSSGVVGWRSKMQSLTRGGSEMVHCTH